MAIRIIFIIKKKNDLVVKLRNFVEKYKNIAG